MRNTNEKLEIFRKLNCLGLNDIERIFADDPDLLDHLKRKYLASREDHGSYGNFAFLFKLDTPNARKIFDRIGF